MDTTALWKSLSWFQVLLALLALQGLHQAPLHTTPWQQKSLSSPARPYVFVETSKGGKLSFKQRAEPAWSAGWWARFVPRPTTPCDLANTTYVVIRAPRITTPVRVEKASDYRALLGDFTGPAGSSLSHGFASKAEAKVYCLGANITYPEQVYQRS